MKKLALFVCLTLNIFAETNSVQVIKTYSDIDFNNDGTADILWKKGSGYSLWYMYEDGTHTYKSIGEKSTAYNVHAVADFNSDGIADILWRKGSDNSLWYMDEDGTYTHKNIGEKNKSYKVTAVADFNNDGNADILWKKGSSYSLWYMYEDGTHTYASIGKKSTAYDIHAVADFNNDGVADILWKKGSHNSLWYMHEDGTHTYKNIGGKRSSYKVTAVADFNNDGVADVLWKKGSHNSIWYMHEDGTHTYKNIGGKRSSYKVTAVADFNNDGNADILWKKDSSYSLWYMHEDGTHTYKNIGGKHIDYVALTNNERSNIDFSSRYKSNEKVRTVKKLGRALRESSGLAYVNGTLWTHNDSGAKAELYAIDKEDGSILKTVTVSNATNIDWEDLAFDATYLYIGDFGNNRGKRKDLKIYKVRLDDLENNTDVTAEVIDFSYATQKSFTSTSKSNYNCEAFIAYEHKLYLFTKNHGNNKTDMYRLNTDSGTDVAKKISTFNTKALVTGASMDSVNKSLVLVGYTRKGRPKTWIFTEFVNTEFFHNSKKTYITWKRPYIAQVEGVTHMSKGKLYFSSEKYVIKKYGIRHTLNQKLYTLEY